MSSEGVVGTRPGLSWLQRPPSHDGKEHARDPLVKTSSPFMSPTKEQSLSSDPRAGGWWLLKSLRVQEELHPGNGQTPPNSPTLSRACLQLLSHPTEHGEDEEERGVKPPVKVRWLHLWLWPGTVPTIVGSGPGPLTVVQEVLDGHKVS